MTPYQYLGDKTEEIEKLVGEMLAVGLIRSSISPYSGTGILVKRRDGGWKFCIDYRASNKITVQDKFRNDIIH